MLENNNGIYITLILDALRNLMITGEYYAMEFLGDKNFMLFLTKGLNNKII